MSKESLHKKKRSFSFHDSVHDASRSKPWQVEKSKNKLFQKNLVISKASKKCDFYKHKRENWIHRKLKKEIHKDRQPPTPHNTTQFIVDAVYCPTDPYVYEYDSNKLEYNFQHHAMAGSMMDLMQQRFGNKMEDEENTENQDNNFYVPKLRTVKSADDRFNETYDSDTSENKNYSQFINEAKNGKNLEDIIKHLVCEIRKKDDQINTLLAETNRQTGVQEN